MRALIYACLGLLALALLSLPIAPLLIDWSRYRPELAAAGSRWLGAPVKIGGGITVELLPRMVVTLSAVTVGGSGKDSILSARLVRLRPTLSSFLLGRLDVQSITLVEPALALDAFRDRAWPDWPAGLAQIDFDNGRIVETAAGVTRARLQHLAGSINAGTAQGAIEFDVRAGAAGAATALKGIIGRAVNGPTGVALNLAGNAGSARFTGTVDAAAGQPRLSGRLSLSASDAAGLLRPLVQLTGFGGDALDALAAPLTLNAAVTAGGGVVDLAGIQAELAGVAIDGRLKASSGAVPTLDAVLRITHLEAPPLIERWRALATGGRFRLPRDIAGTLELNVDSIGWHAGLIRQVQLAVVLGDGEAVMRHLTAQLPGGSELSAFGTLIARSDAPRLDLDFDLSSDNLRLGLDWLGLDMSGAAPTRLRRASLSARLSLTPQQLQLAGVDLRIDSTRLRGGLTLILEEPPAFGLRVALDRLNLDAYRANDSASALAWLAKLPPFDANLSLGADLLTLDGASLRDLNIEAMVRGGEVTLKSARIADLAGASLAVTGTLSSSAAGPAADLGFELAATDPGQLLRLSGVNQRVAPDRLGPIRASGRLAGPVARLALEAKLGAKGRTTPLAGTLAVAAFGARSGPSIALAQASLDAIAKLAGE